MKFSFLTFVLSCLLMACHQAEITTEVYQPLGFRSDNGLFDRSDYDSINLTFSDGYIFISNDRLISSGYENFYWQSSTPRTGAESKMFFTPVVTTWQHGSYIQPVGTPVSGISRDLSDFPAMQSYQDGVHIPITYGEITRTLYLPPALKLLSYPFTVIPSEDPDQEEIFVDRNNFTLTWNADTANHKGVIIHIHCTYPGMNNPKNYERYEVVPDNGACTIPAAAFGTIENGATFKLDIFRGDYAIIYPVVNNQRKRIVITTKSTISSQELTMLH